MSWLSDSPDGHARVKTAYATVEGIDQQGIPYVYGGGHSRDFAPSREIRNGVVLATGPKGYDCSGLVSVVCHNAGILAIPHAWFPFDTNAFEHWGLPGKGRWHTIWVEDSPTVHHCAEEFNLQDPRYPKRWAQAAHPGTRVGWFDFDPTGFIPRHWPGT